MAKDSWYLGKNLGVPAGSWKSMGKKLGIGLTEGDLAYKQGLREQRMMDRGTINTPQEQYEAGSRSADKGVRSATAMGGLDYLARGEGGGFRGEAQNMLTLNKPASEWTSGEVSDMQEMLKTAGYTDYEGKPLKADGQLGGRTESALRKYQADMGRGEMVDAPWYKPWAGPSWEAGPQTGPRMESGMFSDTRE